jgi:hypothetical protein
LEEQFLAENFYKPGLNYDNLFSYSFSGVSSNSFEDVYKESESSDSNNHSETMDTEEAKEMLVAVQYAKVTGSMTELNSIDRRRFATWVTFNPALWRLFHKNYSITEDVDYSKSF